MLAKMISAGALTLLLTGGALADQSHKNYAGAQPHPQTSSCKHAFSLPKWQRANGECSALNARASGSTISTLQRATSGHNDYVSHHDAIQRDATSQHNIYAGHRKWAHSTCGQSRGVWGVIAETTASNEVNYGRGFGAAQPPRVSSK
jgi:hypothetical protein